MLLVRFFAILHRHLLKSAICFLNSVYLNNKLLFLVIHSCYEGSDIAIKKIHNPRLQFIEQSTNHKNFWQSTIYMYIKLSWAYMYMIIVLYSFLDRLSWWGTAGSERRRSSCSSIRGGSKLARSLPRSE